MINNPALLLKADLNYYPWGGSYRPRTSITLAFEKEQGFHVTMRCQEPNPRSVFTNANAAVYEDSCMESFINFYPDDSDIYINFEVNANGAMLCQSGSQRNGRVYLLDAGIAHPDVTTEKTDAFWTVDYLIPLTLIHQVYGKSDFPLPHRIRGNFYKCGDATQSPHFGCWNPIEYPVPNFHLPEFFGNIWID